MNKETDDDPFGRAAGLFGACYGDHLMEIKATLELFILVARSPTIRDLVGTARSLVFEFLIKPITSFPAADFLLCLRTPHQIQEVLMKVSAFFKDCLNDKPLPMTQSAMRLDHSVLGTMYLQKELANQLFEASSLSRRVALWTLQTFRRHCDDSKSRKNFRKYIFTLMRSCLDEADPITRVMSVSTTLNYMDEQFIFLDDENHMAIAQCIEALRKAIAGFKEGEEKLVNLKRSLEKKNQRLRLNEKKFRDYLLADAKAEESSLDLPLEYYIRGNKTLKKAFDARATSRNDVSNAADAVKSCTSKLVMMLCNLRLLVLLSTRIIRIALRPDGMQSKSSNCNRPDSSSASLLLAHEKTREFASESFTGFPWAALYQISNVELQVFGSSYIQLFCAALCKVSNTFQIQMMDETSAPLLHTSLALLSGNLLMNMIPLPDQNPDSISADNVVSTECSDISASLIYWATCRNAFVTRAASQWTSSSASSGPNKVFQSTNDTLQVQPMWLHSLLSSCRDQISSNKVNSTADIVKQSNSIDIEQLGAQHCLRSKEEDSVVTMTSRSESSTIVLFSDAAALVKDRIEQPTTCAVTGSAGGIVGEEGASGHLKRPLDSEGRSGQLAAASDTNYDDSSRPQTQQPQSLQSIATTVGLILLEEMNFMLREAYREDSEGGDENTTDDIEESDSVEDGTSTSRRKFLLTFEGPKESTAMCCQSIPHCIAFSRRRAREAAVEELAFMSIDGYSCESSLLPLHGISTIDFVWTMLGQDRRDEMCNYVLNTTPAALGMLFDKVVSSMKQVIVKSKDVLESGLKDPTAYRRSELLPSLITMNSYMHLLTALLTGSRLPYRYPSDDEAGLTTDYAHAAGLYITQKLSEKVVDAVSLAADFIYSCPHPLCFVGLGIGNIPVLASAARFLTAVACFAPEVIARALSESCSRSALSKTAEVSSMVERGSQLLVPFFLILHSGVEGLADFYSTHSTCWGKLPPLSMMISDEVGGDEVANNRDHVSVNQITIWELMSRTSDLCRCSFFELLNVLTDTLTTPDNLSDRQVRFSFCKLMLAQGSTVITLIHRAMATCIPLSSSDDGALSANFNRVAVLQQLVQLATNLIIHDHAQDAVHPHDFDHHVQDGFHPHSHTASGKSSRSSTQTRGYDSRQMLQSSFLNSLGLTRRDNLLLGPFALTSQQFRLTLGKNIGCAVVSHALSFVNNCLPELLNEFSSRSDQSDAFYIAAFVREQSQRIAPWLLSGSAGSDTLTDEDLRCDSSALRGTHSALWIYDSCFSKCRALRSLSLSVLEFLTAMCTKQLEIQSFFATEFPEAFKDIGMCMKCVRITSDGEGVHKLLPEEAVDENDDLFALCVADSSSQSHHVDANQRAHRAHQCAFRRLRFHHSIAAAASRLVTSLVHRSPPCQLLVLSNGVVEGLFESLRQVPLRYTVKEYHSAVAKDVPIAVGRLCNYKECSVHVIKVADMTGLLKLCVLGSSTIRLMACTAMINATTADLRDVISDLAGYQTECEGQVTVSSPMSSGMKSSTRRVKGASQTESLNDNSMDVSANRPDKSDDFIADKTVSEDVTSINQADSHHAAYVYIADAVKYNAHDVVLQVLEIADDKEQVAALQVYKNLLWSKVVRDSAITSSNVRCLSRYLFSTNAELIRLVCDILLILCLHDRIVLRKAIEDVNRSPGYDISTNITGRVGFCQPSGAAMKPPSSGQIALGENSTSKNEFSLPPLFPLPNSARERSLIVPLEVSGKPNSTFQSPVHTNRYKDQAGTVIAVTGENSRPTAVLSIDIIHRLCDIAGGKDLQLLKTGEGLTFSLTDTRPSSGYRGVRTASRSMTSTGSSSAVIPDRPISQSPGGGLLLSAAQRNHELKVVTEQRRAVAHSAAMVLAGLTGTSLWFLAASFLVH